MKKFIASLIFGVLFLGLMSAYLFLFVGAFKTPVVMIIYIVVVLALAAAMVATLRARYLEIKQEDPDDLKKY